MAGKIIVALYLIAAVAFGAYLQLRQPFATMGAATIGGAIGMAGALIVVPGVIPSIVWVIGQFRPKEARPDYRGFALLTWIVLGAIMGTFIEVQDRYERDQKVNSRITQLDHADFAKQTKAACIAIQKQNSLNRQVGITDSQITIYCGCYADALSKTISIDELRYYVLNGKPPARMQDKVDQTVPGCTNQALRR